MTSRLDELGPLVKERRGRRGITLQQVFDETGISVPTLSRIEHGVMPSVRDFFLIVRWLDMSADWFGAADGEAPGSGYDRGWDDCAAAVASATKRGVER